jgi:type I restriction enzyme R subunit
VEYVASGKQNIRPDIVCFVNGIPFAIIENKKSGVEVGQALSQMVGNQGAEKCPRLYTYAQLLIVANVTELQYGTTGTGVKFYATWKEKGTTEEMMNEKVKKILQKSIHPDIYMQILRDLNGYTVGYKQLIEREITAQDRGVVSLLEPHRLLDLTKNYILYDAGIKKLARYQQYFAINKMLKCIEEREIEHGITRRRGGLVWHTQGS